MEGLLNRSSTAPERASLITVIFSTPDVVESVRGLDGDDAQTFIDVIDEASPWFLRNEITKSDSDFCVLPFRRWIALIAQRE